MKLRDLDACFVADYRMSGNSDSYREQDSIEGAQGLLFICPLCGGHSVLCWFRNPRNAPRVPDNVEPGPGRWTVSGNGLDDLTLYPSVDLDTESTRKAEAQGYKVCKWHGHVENGGAA